MGPSLTPADIELIRGEATFACNKIFLIFPSTTWRPTFYFVSDVLVAEQNREIIRGLGLTSFFSIATEPALGPIPRSLYYRYRPQLLGPEGTPAPEFSQNLLGGLGSGGFTVLYDQLQWAFWMGFTEVVLLGVDFSFTLGPTTGETCIHGAVLAGAGERNHFHPDYRKPGEKWSYPQLDGQRRAFKLAADTFARHGRRLWNASRQTALDCVPRKSLEEILRNPSNGNP